jgi:hypothetical protein
VISALSDRTLLTALVVLVVGAGFVALCVLTVFIWPDRRRRDEEPEHERPPLQVHWAWKVAAISALDSTQDPRNAVIAAYAAMERTFAAHDLGRSRSPRLAP